MAINYSLAKLASKFGDKAGVPLFYARAQMKDSISLKKFAKLISMQTTVSYADVTAVLVSMQENMVIAICLAFRRPVRVLMPRSSSTSWMLPDPLPSRGFFMSRSPPNLFNKLGRIAIRCALFNCRYISFMHTPPVHCHADIADDADFYLIKHGGRTFPATFPQNLLQI